jgi:hypothetical protein
MCPSLDYPDLVTFYSAVSTGYRGSKVAVEAEDIPCYFLQNTGFAQGANQEAVTSDGICFPDFSNQFIVENFNRLEGMYILAQLFGGEANKSWFKITSVTINRDHLLTNEIDNIELNLKKTTALLDNEVS